MKRRLSMRLVRVLLTVDRRQKLHAWANLTGQALRAAGGPQATLAARRWRKAWKRRVDRAKALAALVDALHAFAGHS